MHKSIKALLTTAAAASLALGLAQGAQASLLAYYTFEGNANDVTGNGYDGTTNGGIGLGAGFGGGQAYVFDGTNDYIRLAGLDINTAPLPQLTMGAWVRAASNTGVGARQVISHDNGSFDRSLGWDFRDGGGDPRDWAMFTGNGGVLSSGSDVVIDEWVFLAAVYDQGSSTARLHVNGSTFTRNGVGTGGGHGFTDIGRNPSFGEFFDGTIDNVFFFDEALTISELEDIRMNGIDLGGGNTVSEPASLALLALGLAAFGSMRRRSR